MSDPNTSEVALSPLPSSSLPPRPPKNPSKTQTTPKRFNNSSSSTPLNPFYTSSPILSYSPAPFRRLMSSNDPLLHPDRKTRPLFWFGAIMCLLFCLLVIVFAIVVVIVYLVVNPKYPSFNMANASLKSINFVSPENVNGDLTLLVNFTNPNRKISVRYEYLGIKLYLVDRLIATQVLEPFSQSPRQVRLEMVRFVSTMVYIPPNPALLVQRQVLNNKVSYNIRATFRVRTQVGVARFKYTLHAKCQVEMTSPPNGVLVSRSCTTGRSA